eukprot:TRINITY_DN2630_c0_g4_i1.p1 TRINITY_DN2630_c0_g4~~TRINITY_DN2630_c0_g4_i1.p1  ORF type:complete len:259 (+),score=44.89 TRINITY_DN2630_c0_g4_i1:54-830(+)
MSITVYVRTPDGEVHDMEVVGSDTMHDLYSKASTAADIPDEDFVLKWEENQIQNNEDEEVHQTDMGEGCELLLMQDNTMLVSIEELAEKHDTIGQRLAVQPDLLLILNVSGANKGELTLFSSDLPLSLLHLRLTDPENRVCRINSDFLQGTQLLTLDMLGLTRIAFIGNRFLNSASLLEVLGAWRLDDVLCVGSDFLSMCAALQHVDLSSMRNVVMVPSVLVGCPSLSIVTVPKEALSLTGALAQTDLPASCTIVETY